MNQTSAAPNEKRDTSQKDLLTKKSGSVLANVRWSFVVLAIGVLILGVLIISFPTAIPYSGAIAGGLLTVSLAFGVGEIATAYYRREQAKEICEENLREEAVENS
jgi:uncharacterized membrane protein HdeD (DUF308 family)